ncbi:hypothetical protein M404DRAFT_33828 [Pisolithus tinctorius Marx 270]|uniref:Uncharacterized protein n=1 Tax=Pisolithus tinctorius Marx 270 TaxID=870435 RepID=A0A0C3JE17_PISTI|nr:hypothetical protein M404DRAFT_33828 [Pisolithus tinctorius Marx 270]
MSTAEKLEAANEQITTLSAEIAKNAGTQIPLQVQKLTDDVGSIKNAIEEVKDHLKTQTPPEPFPMPYRDALATYTTNPNQILLGKCPTQEHAKAHAAIRDRQILINPDRDHPIFNDSTKRETAIDLIRQAIEAVDRVDGPEIQLKSIACLQNNGILLEFNSQEATAWIKKVPNQATFLEKLGGMTTIKDRIYSVVIPFLSIATDLDRCHTPKVLWTWLQLTLPNSSTSCAQCPCMQMKTKGLMRRKTVGCEQSSFAQDRVVSAKEKRGSELSAH